ncbi:hypothetical protein BKM88_02725 [Anaplasma marginale]|uniref:hypothetical protein n=1 Tax=Anaplasma marginale TaxID=770 RepID=UPI000E576E41|nr:hypothetical protein [Anaplasma marginale]AXW85485.1 hypothetical protein BKM88_02725 [Anaplasma marginale]
MTEATQGNLTAATSTSAHRPGVNTTPESQAYIAYTTKGASGLEQHISSGGATSVEQELGFGTNHCILEAAVKGADKRAVELLCERFSASVLQRTLHLNSTGESLLEQAIKCNDEQNPAIALEILKKLCETCASECVASGKTFGVVAKDLIASLLAVTKQSNSSDIQHWSPDQSWQYSSPANDGDLEQEKQQRREQSERYRKEAQDAYEKAYRVQAHCASQTSADRTQTTASHAQPSPTQHNAEAHDKLGSHSEQTTAGESGSGEALQSTSQTEEVATTGSTHEAQTESMTGASVVTSHTDTGARHVATEPSVTALARGVDSAQTAEGANTEKDNERDVAAETDVQPGEEHGNNAVSVSDQDDGVSYVAIEDETAAEGATYDRDESESGLAQDEVEQLRTSTGADLESSGAVVSEGIEYAAHETAPAKGGAATRTQQAAPKKVKAAARQGNGGRFPRTTHATHAPHHSDDHQVSGAGAHNNFLQFAEKTKNDVETVVVELEAQTLPEGASALLETISAILQDIGTQVESAKDKVSSVAAGAAAPQTLREKVIGLLNNLVNTIRDLLAKLGSVASNQSRKLGDISRQVANKVQEFGAKSAPTKRAGAPSDSDDMAPAAKRRGSAPTAYAALLDEILTAAEQGKLADALQRHVDALSDPKTLHSVLSHRNAASLNALDLCVAKQQNVGDITAAIRVLMKPGNQALGAVLAHHLTQAEGRQNQSIIQRIIGVAASSESADPSVVSSAIELVTCLIGELCPSSGDVGQRLLAGHVARSALQAGSADIFSHAMTVAAVPRSDLVHNPIQDAIVASAVTWIENSKCEIGSDQDARAIKAVMSLLQSCGKVSPSAAQEIVARCSVASTAALVYKVARECNVIDPGAKCSAGTQAYVTRYELARAMSALHAAAANVDSSNSADLGARVEELLRHIDTILTAVSALTGRQWISAAVQLVPRTQTITKKIQHVCDSIAAGTTPSLQEEDITQISEDAQQISQMIRDVANKHPAQRIRHTLQTFNARAVSSEDRNLVSAYERLRAALESARDAYKGPFYEISIENFANSLNDAAKDIISAIDPVGDHGGTLRLELRSATRKIVDSISDNPHLVFCSQKVAEELLHAAALLELATKREVLSEREGFATDRTAHELVNSFREKATNAYYHITRAYRLVEEHGTALREHGGESVALALDKLRNAGNHVKQAAESVSYNVRVTAALEAEALCDYCKNALLSLCEKLRDSEALQHLQRAAHVVYEHIVNALVFLRLAAQILKDIVVHAIKVASGNARVTAHSLNNPESSLLDVMPAICARIGDADTALARSNNGADYSKLREALRSANSVLLEIGAALPSGNYDFLDGNAPHLILHACAREISRHNLQGQLGNRMREVLTDLESVVGRLVDINALNTLEQSPAVEVPEEFVRSSLKTLAYTLQVRSAAAGVRALVPGNRLAEIAGMLPVSDGKVVITSGADLAVALRALIEEHNITHVRNAANRDDPIVVLSEISRAIGRSAAARGAQEAGSATDDVVTAVPVQFVYNALVACSNAMQLSTAIDGVKARIPGDMLNEVMVAGLPNDARQSRMVSDASVISTMIDNLIRLHKGLMHQDAVYTAHNAPNRGCLDLVREVIDQKITFDLGQAVPASVYSTEPRAAFIGGVVEQALIMPDSEFLGAQAESRYGEGERTVPVNTDVAHGIVVAAMHAIQEAVIHDSRRRTIPPSLPSDDIRRIVPEAASASGNTMDLSTQMVSDAFQRFKNEMVRVGALAQDTEIWDKLVRRVVSVVMHTAARYTGSDASVRGHSVPFRHVEKMVTSIYIDTQKEHCRSAIRAALKGVQDVDQDLVKEAAKYATTLVICGGSANKVPKSSCVSLAWKIASTLSAGDVTVRHTIAQGVLSLVANFREHSAVVVSEQFFVNLFTTIRNSVKRAHAAASAEASKAPIAVAFAELTDEMIRNLAQGVIKIHSVAQEFWENGTVVEESSKVSEREAEQRATTAANSVDGVPFGLARTVLIATISAVVESVARAEHLGAAHIEEHQIAALVESKLKQQASSDETLKITSDLVSGMLTELNSVILQKASSTGMSNRAQISEDLHPAIARIAVSAIRAGKTTGNSISDTLLDRVQHDIHAARGTAITAPAVHSRLARAAAPLVLDLATVFAGLNDAKGVMEELITGSNSSKLTEGQKERIQFAIGAAESLMERISTRGIRDGAERIQDDIRLVVSTIAGMHRDGNLAPSDQCAISAAYGALVAQLGLVEAARTSENVTIVPGYGHKGFAPRMVEVGHAAMDAGQQKPHLSSDTEGGAEPDKTITHLNRTARLLKSINQFLVHSGIYNTLQGGKLLHHLRAVRHQLEIAQQAALFTLLTKVAGGRDTESVVPHERALQEAITRSQECLLNAKLVAAPLSKDAVSMLSGLSDAVTLLQETSQQRFASQPQRILGEDWAPQIFRMVSIARSAADSAQKEEVAASAISRDEIAARNGALMHLGAVENLVGFLYDARTQRDARLVEQVLSHLEQCKNNLRAQLVHRRNAIRAEGAQRDAVQHYSAFVQVAMHAVHMAHDLICEHVRGTSHNILDGWRATASSLGSAQPDPQEVRQRAAALIDVYEAARDAGMLVSKVCMKTRNNVFVPRKSASQVLCESAYASGSRIIDAPRHQEVEHELTILVGDALSAKALLNQVCTKIADHEDGGIVRLMGNIDYATDAMLNRDRGIAASKEVVQLSNRIAALTKSGLAKLATVAKAANSPAASATDLVRVSGSATPTQTQESLAAVRRTLTAAQWFKTIVDVSSHVPEVTSTPATTDTKLQEEINGASQDLSRVVQLLYGYGLNKELDTAQKGVVNALNSAVGLLPLLTGTGGYSIPDSLHPNTVNVVYRLGSSDIPQGNIGALAARFEVITHKLSLLMSLRDLESIAGQLEAIQDSDAKVREATQQFGGIVRNVTALVKSVVQRIENAAPVRSLEASNAEGNRVILQELRSVAVGALTRSYEQRGLQGLRESIKSVRESIGQQFVVVDSTLLQNMFSLRDVDSAEVLCSEAALPPEHDRVEKVIATIADALRTGRIDPVRTLSCLDRVLKNSVALGTLHTDETGAYALCEADVTDMLMAFYKHNDEDGIRFLRGRCGAYTIDSSRIESAVLARLGNNASLNTADTLLLDSYQQDIFTDPDVSIRQCQKVGASFLEIHLDRAYGQRGIHRRGSIRKDGIGAARRRQPADRQAAGLTTKLFQKMPKRGEDQQPWYLRVWQWIIDVVNWSFSVVRTAIMSILGKGGKAQASLQQQEDARQADISSARSADAGSGKGAPDDGHDHGADDKPKTSPLSAVAVRRSSEAHKMGEEAQQPWYMRLWQWVKDAVTSFVLKYLYPIFTRIVGSKAENRFVETAEPGKRAAQEVQQERSNDRNVAKGEESHRGGASETVEATKSEVAEEHSSPESENHEERLRAADGDAHLKNRKQGAEGQWLKAEDAPPSSTITDAEVVREVGSSKAPQEGRRNSVS